MPSKSRMVKGSRKRLFIKRPVFIDCNCCSHREESLHVISCLSSHSDVQTFLPRLSLSRRPSHCRAGNISSHRHVTQRGTQADWWGGQTACEETLNKIWQRERGGRGRRQDSNVWGRKTSEGRRPEDWNTEWDRRRAHLKAVDSSNIQINFSHVEWNLEYSELNIQFAEKTDSN